MKNGLTNIIVIMLVCSFFFSSCGNMAIGQLDAVLNQSLILVDYSRNLYAGYSEFNGVGYIIGVTEFAGQYFVSSVVQTTPIEMRAQADVMRLSRSVIATSWATLPYGVKQAVTMYYSQVVMQSVQPVGVPIIVMPVFPQLPVLYPTVMPVYQ